MKSEVRYSIMKSEVRYSIMKSEVCIKIKGFYVLIYTHTYILVNFTNELTAAFVNDYFSYIACVYTFFYLIFLNLFF
jgi:hypothetical protein